MSVPSVQLGGSGMMGLIPLAAHALLDKQVRKLPTRVKLGRLPAKPDAKCLLFADYFRPQAGAPIPDQVDWGTRAARSIGKMYANDRYGDCVWAEIFHQFGVWGSADADSGGEVIGTDQEVLNQYRKVCGPGDNGCVMVDVMDYITRHGVQIAGGTRPVDGFARLDVKDWDAIRVGVDLFGGVALGIGFREAWSRLDTWGPTDSPVIGGHAVLAFAYDPAYVYLSSWGRVYRMPREVVTSSRYVDEMFVRLAQTWYGNDRLAPCGVQVDPLKAALASFGGGHTPPIPEPPAPTPPEPPTPPTPPAPPSPWCWPVFDIELTGVPSGYTGVIRPRTDPPAGGVYSVPIHADHIKHWETLAVILNRWPGVLAFPHDGKFHVERGKLSPEQWAAIIAAIATFAEALAKILGGG